MKYTLSLLVQIILLQGLHYSQPPVNMWKDLLGCLKETKSPHYCLVRMGQLFWHLPGTAILHLSIELHSLLVILVHAIPKKEKEKLRPFCNSMIVTHDIISGPDLGILIGGVDVENSESITATLFATPPRFSKSHDLQHLFSKFHY